MNKYGYVEVRKLDYAVLRGLCISKRWYTKGDIQEYSNMLNMCNIENVTTDTIVEIATDIYSHSVESDYTITSICFEIARICTTFFEEV